MLNNLTILPGATLYTRNVNQFEIQKTWLKIRDGKRYTPGTDFMTFAAEGH